MIWGICDGKKMNAWMIGGEKTFLFYSEKRGFGGSADLVNSSLFRNYLNLGINLLFY